MGKNTSWLAETDPPLKITLVCFFPKSKKVPSGRQQKKEHRYSFEGKIPEDEINNSPDLRYFFKRLSSWF